MNSGGHRGRRHRVGMRPLASEHASSRGFHPLHMQIVARAIKAHGGETKLTRRAYSIELKGRFFVGGEVIEHSDSIKGDGPNRGRYP